MKKKLLIIFTLFLLTSCVGSSTSGVFGSGDFVNFSLQLYLSLSLKWMRWPVGLLSSHRLWLKQMQNQHLELGTGSGHAPITIHNIWKTMRTEDLRPISANANQWHTPCLCLGQSPGPRINYPHTHTHSRHNRYPAPWCRECVNVLV